MGVVHCQYILSRGTLGAGAAAGGAVGAAASWNYSKGSSAQRAKNVVIGTALGAGVGAIAGHAIHKSQEKKIQAAIEESQRKAGRAPQGYYGDPAGLANGRWEPAKLERRYLEGYVDGNIYHEPHFVWVLIEPGKFRN